MSDIDSLIRHDDPEFIKKAALPVADADGAAIASLIMAFFIPFVGLILGLVSRSQAKHKGMLASPVANWGIGLSVLGCIAWVIVIIWVLVALANGNTDCVNQAVQAGLDPSLMCGP